MLRLLFKKPVKESKTPKVQKIEALEKKLQSKNEVFSELMEEHIKLKKSWGTVKRVRVPHCG
jgi:transposase